ncbi:helix-turn-helix domain-containing protein [Halobacillus sp. B23F22_1]|uniref:helix-turn-helix domain-containing protein n=1 Tax=Halobacillus sp. B23F22_1 TaxID=3459514 RepID=UPI00373EE6E9
MENKLYELLLRAKENDEQAKAEVIQRFEPKIKKLSSTLPSWERDDLEQELRIQLVHSIEKFNVNHLVAFWKYYEEQ